VQEEEEEAAEEEAEEDEIEKEKELSGEVASIRAAEQKKKTETAERRAKRENENSSEVEESKGGWEMDVDREVDTETVTEAESETESETETETEKEKETEKDANKEKEKGEVDGEEERGKEHTQEQENEKQEQEEEGSLPLRGRLARAWGPSKPVGQQRANALSAGRCPETVDGANLTPRRCRSAASTSSVARRVAASQSRSEGTESREHAGSAKDMGHEGQKSLENGEEHDRQEERKEHEHVKEKGEQLLQDPYSEVHEEKRADEHTDEHASESGGEIADESVEEHAEGHSHEHAEEKQIEQCTVEEHPAEQAGMEVQDTVEDLESVAKAEQAKDKESHAEKDVEDHIEKFVEETADAHSDELVHEHTEKLLAEEQAQEIPLEHPKEDADLAFEEEALEHGDDADAEDKGEKQEVEEPMRIHAKELWESAQIHAEDLVVDYVGGHMVERADEQVEDHVEQASKQEIVQGKKNKTSIHAENYESKDAGEHAEAHAQKLVRLLAQEPVEMHAMVIAQVHAEELVKELADEQVLEHASGEHANKRVIAEVRAEQVVVNQDHEGADEIGEKNTGKHTESHAQKLAWEFADEHAEVHAKDMAHVHAEVLVDESQPEEHVEEEEHAQEQVDVEFKEDQSVVKEDHEHAKEDEEEVIGKRTKAHKEELVWEITVRLIEVTAAEALQEHENEQVGKLAGEQAEEHKVDEETNEEPDKEVDEDEEKKEKKKKDGEGHAEETEEHVEEHAEEHAERTLMDKRAAEHEDDHREDHAQELTGHTANAPTQDNEEELVGVPAEEQVDEPGKEQKEEVASHGHVKRQVDAEIEQEGQEMQATVEAHGERLAPAAAVFASLSSSIVHLRRGGPETPPTAERCGSEATASGLIQQSCPVVETDCDGTVRGVEQCSVAERAQSHLATVMEVGEGIFAEDDACFRRDQLFQATRQGLPPRENQSIPLTQTVAQERRHTVHLREDLNVIEAALIQVANPELRSSSDLLRVVEDIEKSNNEAECEWDMLMATLDSQRNNIHGCEQAACPILVVHPEKGVTSSKFSYSDRNRSLGGVHTSECSRTLAAAGTTTHSSMPSRRASLADWLKDWEGTWEQTAGHVLQEPLRKAMSEFVAKVRSAQRSLPAIMALREHGDAELSLILRRLVEELGSAAKLLLDAQWSLLGQSNTLGTLGSKPTDRRHGGLGFRTHAVAAVEDLKCASACFKLELQRHRAGSC